MLDLVPPFLNESALTVSGMALIVALLYASITDNEGD